MRSVVYSESGGPEVLNVVERDVTEPDQAEVRVRIHRSGVNPTDWKARRGAAAGTPVDPPQTPNQDGSGVIDKLGAGVTGFETGQRVWVWEAAHQRPFGTAAEFAVVPATQVVALPVKASFDLGATLGVRFITAHRCLTVAEHGPSRLAPGALEGCRLLVAGGAGAVGNAVIQLARWAGATVITTVSSPHKAQLAEAAGAEHVIDYKTQDVASEVRKIAPRGLDLIAEVAPAQNAALDAELLAPHGTIAVYANNGGDAMTLPVRSLMSTNARWQFVLLYGIPLTTKQQATVDITAALHDGAVRVGDDAGLPLTHFTLDDTPAAHTAVEDGAIGKVLIDVVP